MHVVHTVHNVLPHEESAIDRTIYGKVYMAAKKLFVHSDWSRKELLRIFPALDGRVTLMRHGLFSIYGRRTGARQCLRKRLGIADDQVALLFCGAIRPYKNIDSVITALKDKRCRNVVLVVSGKESSYSPPSASEPLSRTRRLAEKEGVLDRIKLLPGFLKRTEMAELFEAGDAVVLPYVRGYGSGMLLLGMAFEKHILSTETGGAEEYLKSYGRYTLLRGTAAVDVAEGICEFLEEGHVETPVDTSELAWSNIARQALENLNETFR
jgi:glycosyltransferase involved in cell wall biosynthesis